MGGKAAATEKAREGVRALFKKPQAKKAKRAQPLYMPGGKITQKQFARENKKRPG